MDLDRLKQAKDIIDSWQEEFPKLFTKRPHAKKALPSNIMAELKEKWLPAHAAQYEGEDIQGLMEYALDLWCRGFRYSLALCAEDYIALDGKSCGKITEHDHKRGKIRLKKIAKRSYYSLTGACARQYLKTKNVAGTAKLYMFLFTGQKKNGRMKEV